MKHTSAETASVTQEAHRLLRAAVTSPFCVPDDPSVLLASAQRLHLLHAVHLCSHSGTNAPCVTFDDELLYTINKKKDVHSSICLSVTLQFIYDEKVVW